MQLLLFLEKIIDVLDSTELVIIISRMAIGVFFFFFFQRRKEIYIHSDNLLLLFHANKLGEEGEGRKLGRI